MAVMSKEAAKREKRYHRFHGYDYSRGAVLFITFGLKKRLPVFGRAEGDKVVYNKVGEAVVEPIDSMRWPVDEWWTGVGNIDLIGENSRLAAFKLSRSIPREEIAAVYVVLNWATGRVEWRFKR